MASAARAFPWVPVGSTWARKLPMGSGGLYVGTKTQEDAVSHGNKMTLWRRNPPNSIQCSAPLTQVLPSSSYRPLLQYHHHSVMSKRPASSSLAKFPSSLSRFSPGTEGADDGVESWQQRMMFLRNPRTWARSSGKLESDCRDISTCWYKHISTSLAGAAYISIVVETYESILFRIRCHAIYCGIAFACGNK